MLKLSIKPSLTSTQFYKQSKYLLREEKAIITWWREKEERIFLLVCFLFKFGGTAEHSRLDFAQILKAAVEFLPFKGVFMRWDHCWTPNRRFNPTHPVFLIESAVVSLQRWLPRTVPSRIHPYIINHECDLTHFNQQNVVKTMLTLKKAWLPSLVYF